MPCTTLLVGRAATYDGSTMTARNEDSGAGGFDAKKLIVVEPEDQPGKYQSVLSHFEMDLPDDPMRYTAMPNADPKEGIWGAAGVNAANVSMTATETITSNERVLGADPLVKYIPAANGQPERAGGIGEEDIVTITLPYIHSAREGVQRLGAILTEFGTYEMNGIAFQDVDEIWWLETIGGHHWIARRVPDNAYVVMPNQLGIDDFDLADAFGEQKEYMCSPDLREFIEDNHLDLSLDGKFNARYAFGSASDADHCYNTPRAWYMERYFNPHTAKWEGEDADFTPESDDIPWCRVPERRITVEDAKYVLSSYYQGTPYDPYGKGGDATKRGIYRPIGINRNNFLSLVQIRPYLPIAFRAIEWVAFGSNAFNAFLPLYANIHKAPAYVSNVETDATTENLYWASRLIGAVSDAHFANCIPHIERYQMAVASRGYAILAEYDKKAAQLTAASAAEGVIQNLLDEADEKLSAMAKEETTKVLNNVLYESSMHMKNAFSRADG